MTSSLSSALTGLQAHQDWIDLIGNNLANSNTPGYKTGSARFSDQYNQTLRYASGPSAGLGGVNPVQIGSGVRLADIGRNFAQGALSSTGRPLDVAIDGQGFFMMSNGSRVLFTRVGTFGIDGGRNLVDQRSGFKVLNRAGAPIQLDTEAAFAPTATTTVSIAGNLPAQVNGPLPEIMTGTAALVDGDPATIAGTNTGPFPIPVGQTWSMSIIVSGGVSKTVNIPGATGGVSAATIAAAIDAIDGVTSSVNGAGQVVVGTERTGESASIKVVPGSTGLDLANALGLATTLVQGAQSPVTTATTLDDLPGNVTQYTSGDTIRVVGVDADGTAINTVFTFGASNDGTTVNQFVAFLDNLYTNATVALDNQGRIQVTADTPGESDLALSISDSSSSTGKTQWQVYATATTQQGTKADEVSTTAEVYDAAGLAHAVTFDFVRQADGSWTATPSIAANEGTIVSGPITDIRFANDGTPLGLSGLDTDITVQFAGSNTTQTFRLDMGSSASFVGITQYGSGGDLVVREQDGNAAGVLDTIAVDGDGSLIGTYSNGKTRSLGELGIATFANTDGLNQVSDTAYSLSANSGPANITAGSVGKAGRVVGGSLEGSNVDTAEQFVHLIEAQRGFQANSRVISAQDEVLRDLVNLV
ncbi:MAG: flagellar hook-basal body complex protein [Planctomycetota bacterium]|nr:flagellar hook-basal body complex protein [Planctomycetota bacterium]